jgi:LruC domain-containing protein
MDEMSVPDFFTYKTSKALHLAVSAESANQNKLKKVPFKVAYSIGGEWKNSIEGSTGQSGSAELTINIPDAAQQLKVTTSYLGLPSEKIINLDGAEQLEIVLGEENREGLKGGVTGQQFLQKNKANKPQKTEEPAGRFASQFTYMGTYSSTGKPDYLDTPNDVVSQEFYDLINSSLPESQPVPTYHPEYLEDDLVTTVNLIEEGEVWVTFVHEGAGYRNSLGYYVYPTDTPPNSMEEIDELTIIFPNVSFQGSGGSLVTGNKVYLGTFPAGMSVGWFLVPDGWNGSTQEVEFNEDEDIKFSDEVLNDFTQPEYRQHIALLYDQSLQTLILGMEDINRPGGDNDFNDAVFYVTVTPFSAVQTSALAAADNTNDDDEDGVSNSVDVAPNDPSIAFHAFTPAQGTFGTLAFEDLFPSQGDYDMNDLVVDYNFKEYLSPENEIVKMDVNLTLRAAGGVHHSGIGFELGVPPSAVASVSGYQFSGGNISLAANGTEEGQAKAVVLAFNDCLALLGGGSLINTELGKANVDAVDLNLTVVFTQPVSRAELGTAPFNPFLFNKEVRGKEVHLPGYSPTSLVNADYFGSGDDVTDPENGIFYKTANNLPFAIDIPVSFDYLIERAPINQGHLKFTQWAESGGSAFSDWYLDGGDYRAMDKIY